MGLPASDVRRAPVHASEAPMTSVTRNAYDYVANPDLMNTVARECAEQGKDWRDQTLVQMPVKIVVMEEADAFEPTKG
jgi:hypothetical protein